MILEPTEIYKLNMGWPMEPSAEVQELKWALSTNMDQSPIV